MSPFPQHVRVLCALPALALLASVGCSHAQRTDWREQPALSASLDAHDYIAFGSDQQKIVNTGAACRPQDSRAGPRETGGLIYVVQSSADRVLRTEAFCLLAGHAAPPFIAQAVPVPDISGNVASLGWRNRWTVSTPAGARAARVGTAAIQSVMDRVYEALDQQKLCDDKQEDAAWAGASSKVRDSDFESCDRSETVVE